MADLTLTLGPNKSEVGDPQPHLAEIIPGQPFDPTLNYVGKMVALDPTTRRWTLASAAAAGTSTGALVGLCVSQRDRGISIKKTGFVSNKELPVAPALVGAKLFLSNTNGGIADAAGTTTLSIGRVIPATDGYGPDNTPLVFLDIPWN